MTSRWLLPISAALIVALSGLPSAQAKVPDRNYWRWFEVEVLLFEHQQEQTIDEHFPKTVTGIKVANATDLLTPWLNQDHHNLSAALPLCDEPSTDSGAALPVACRYEDEQQWIPIPGNPLTPPQAIDSINTMNVVIDGPGGDISTATQPFLMPASSHVLTETRTELERKGLANPLLHVAWRQPVFGENDDNAMRLFAGQQFTQEYGYDGFVLKSAGSEQPQPLTPVEKTDALLAAISTNPTAFGQQFGDQPSPLKPNPKLPQRVWELDGLLHVFLIGNYLHIDGEFNLREEQTIALHANNLDEQAAALLANAPAEQQFLQAFHFDQLRRVISHETHYFDHPKLGMVVQIRRTKLSARRY